MRIKDEATKEIYDGKSSKKARARLPEKLWALARKKIDYVLAAKVVVDLRIPPSNRLEPLSRDLAGNWSIRINDQYRIIFAWNGQAEDIEIIDYH
jgi:toxin HigB-1